MEFFIKQIIAHLSLRKSNGLFCFLESVPDRMIESRGIRNKKSLPSFFMYRQPQDTDRDFQSRFRSQVKEKNEMLRLWRNRSEM